jgi:hypothetical protein
MEQSVKQPVEQSRQTAQTARDGIEVVIEMTSVEMKMSKSM